ncbi:MAG: hypothetical protein WBV94_11405 [Blastocatellia bacterium]
MRNEFTQYIIDRVSVTGGATFALRFRCAKLAPSSQMDWTTLKKT